MRVTHLHRWPAEPAPARSAGPGACLPELLSAVLQAALQWAPEPRAVILSGSHAAGEAVWVEHRGRAVSLSDVDLYVLLDDDAGCRAARSRQRAALRDLAGRCFSFGLAAPFEAGFHTPSGLARLPARPGTIELARHGRVLHGDARALDLVPRIGPGDVSAEEIVLLLENRGCELLWCLPGLAAEGPLDRLKARHSTLKCALDLAGVKALLGGEYPDGARSRVAWARHNRPAQGTPEEAAAERELDRMWDVALAWRSGEVAPLSPAQGEEEWMAVARAWARVWWETGARIVPRAPSDAVGRALALARRARLSRRLREALAPRAASDSGRRPLLDIVAGTLQHRVHASATLLLLVAAAGQAGPLPLPTASALARLGVVPNGAGARWDAARDAVVRAWDRWLLDGQRTATAS